MQDGIYREAIYINRLSEGKVGSGCSRGL